MTDEHITDEVADYLGRDVTWENPPGDLGDRIDAAIAAEPDRRRPGRWLYGVAALFIVISGFAAVFAAIQGDSVEPDTVIAMAGTNLAPEANGTAGLISTPNGWAINLEVTGLEPAPEDTFYQGWVSNGTDSVAVGTFHMRGAESAPIELWSGVDLREFTTLNITLQDVGAGPASSGRLVMTGTATSFD